MRENRFIIDTGSTCASSKKAEKSKNNTRSQTHTPDGFSFEGNVILTHSKPGNMMTLN